MSDTRLPLREFLRAPCEAPNWLFGALCLISIWNGAWALVRLLGG